MNIKRYTVIVLSATMLLTSSCGSDADTDDKQEETVLIPLVTTSTVLQKEFKHELSAQGDVKSDQDALINAEASGVIKKIHAKEGQRVVRGQVLITIDSQILQSTIEEVENSLELATYMYEKQKKLMDEGVGTEFDFKTAKNNKIALEKKLKTMRSQKGKTLVKAPFSGFVESLMVNEGEMAAPQIPLLRVVNIKKVSVESDISENLLASIKVGSEVELIVPSLNDTSFKVKVDYVGKYIDKVNRTFKIRIDLNDNSILVPNQLVKVQLTDFSQSEALVVNSEAILLDADNNSYVYVLSDKIDGHYGVKKIYVKEVKRFKGEAMITGEIKKGDQVVIRGAKGITEADKVDIL